MKRKGLDMSTNTKQVPKHFSFLQSEVQAKSKVTQVLILSPCHSFYLVKIEMKSQHVTFGLREGLVLGIFLGGRLGYDAEFVNGVMVGRMEGEV